MSTKNFPSAAFDLSLIPPNDIDDDDGADAAYARDAKTLDTNDLALIVAARLGDHPALLGLIEDTKRAPFTSHDRRTLHVSDALRLGDAIAALLADAMDELIEVRLATQEVAQ